MRMPWKICLKVQIESALNRATLYDDMKSRLKVLKKNDIKKMLNVSQLARPTDWRNILNVGVYIRMPELVLMGGN